MTKPLTAASRVRSKRRRSPEMFRRRRLGDIRRLLDWCCGPILPDADDGREYLTDLLFAMSLGRNPRAGMMQTVRDRAPWLTEDEAADHIDCILKLPAKGRRSTAEEIGQSLRVINEERERLRLWTIRPVDMTDEQLAEQKKAKDRARENRKRARVPRDAWLEKNNLSKQQPWKAKNMSRASWYRRKAETGVSQEKESITRTDLSHGAPDAAKGTGKGRDTRARPPRARLHLLPSPHLNQNGGLAALMRGTASQSDTPVSRRGSGMAKLGSGKMQAHLKRQALIAEIANYLVREPSLDAHGDKLCDVAFAHFKERIEDREFTQAIVALVRTLRELTALDRIESQFNYMPPPTAPLPRSRAARRAPPATQLNLFTGKDRA